MLRQQPDCEGLGARIFEVFRRHKKSKGKSEDGYINRRMDLSSNSDSNIVIFLLIEYPIRGAIKRHGYQSLPRGDSLPLAPVPPLPPPFVRNSSLKPPNNVCPTTAPTATVRSSSRRVHCNSGRSCSRSSDDANRLPATLSSTFYWVPP
jgi:hypothetical protein